MLDSSQCRGNGSFSRCLEFLRNKEKLRGKCMVLIVRCMPWHFLVNKQYYGLSSLYADMPVLAYGMYHSL